MKTPRRNWSENEVRKALSLYLVTDFGRIHNRNKDIITLANIIKRTPNAVALKLANLAALDDSLPRKGMANASKVDRAVWAEFLKNPAFVLKNYQEFQQQNSENMSDLVGSREEALPRNNGFSERSEAFIHEKITERQVSVNQRVGQDYFRKMILTSYNGQCALTGIEDERLLNASHIVAWKDDEINRLNPRNGICLNALHDRAFDRHLISFDEDYRILVSSNIPKIAKQKLERVETRRLQLPSRFLPDQDFLERHRQVFFEKSTVG